MQRRRRACRTLPSTTTRSKAAEAGRRLKELEAPHKLAQEWRTTRSDLEAARDDSDLRELVPELESRLAEVEEELKLALVCEGPGRPQGRDRRDPARGLAATRPRCGSADVFRMLPRATPSTAG